MENRRATTATPSADCIDYLRAFSKYTYKSEFIDEKEEEQRFNALFENVVRLLTVPSEFNRRVSKGYRDLANDYLAGDNIVTELMVKREVKHLIIDEVKRALGDDEGLSNEEGFPPFSERMATMSFQPVLATELLRDGDVKELAGQFGAAIVLMLACFLTISVNFPGPIFADTLVDSVQSRLAFAIKWMLLTYFNYIGIVFAAGLIRRVLGR